jgi:hypothetical protein
LYVKVLPSGFRYVMAVVIYLTCLFGGLSFFGGVVVITFLLIFMFFPIHRWWPPGDIDAFCCAAGTAAVDMVPVAEARWPWSSQHPQPGRGNACEPGLGARLSQAAPASNRVSAHFSLFPSSLSSLLALPSES